MARTPKTTPRDGNNDGHLTDAQQQALLAQHVKAVKGWKDELASVNSRLRTAYKSAKADGFPKKDIDFALALENDKGQILEDRARQQQIAKWMSHPIGHQLSMFDQDPRPLNEKAYDDGHAAGLMAKDMSSNPYDVTSKQGQEWLRGWHDGQAKTKDEFFEEIRRNNKMAAAENEPPASQDDPFADGGTDEGDVAPEPAGETEEANEEPVAAPPVDDLDDDPFEMSNTELASQSTRKQPTTAADGDETKDESKPAKPEKKAGKTSDKAKDNVVKIGGGSLKGGAKIAG